MAKNTKELLTKVMKEMDQINYIPIQDFPNIDLYMDQVTTFMDSHLASSKRYSDDKILTKTMINNYAKNQLLPAPEKKKYSREHMLTLAFIYYFKNILSISDIQKLLDPLLKKYFNANNNFNLSDIYEEIFALEGSQLPRMKNDISQMFEMCSESFENVPAKEREFLQQFALICELSFDVYYKKLLVEKMIDSLDFPDSFKNETKKDSRNENKKESKKEDKKKEKK